MDALNVRRGRLPAVLMTLVLSSACTAGAVDSAGGAAAGKPTVRVALGVDASYAPFYLAEEQGLFEKAGLNVELVKTEGGPAATEAVTAGTAQIAANADSTALSLMVGSPGLRALGVFQSSDRYLKVVLRDGIKSPKQIKTMASIAGLGLYATHSYLRHNGIDPKSVKILQSSPPEIPGLLEQGSIDAYVLFEPWAARGDAAGGHIAGRIGDFGVKYVQWLIADQKWLKGNEEVAGKIFKVVADADKLVTDDPDAAAKASNQQVKLPVADTRKVLPEITFAARGIDDADVTESRKIVDFLLAQKLIKKSPDLDTALLKGWYEQHGK
ncbi:ABC transporter substrate-binding protein [Streptomyces phaeochromogenes]|uniref:ABC transporter substrate-binding protein n=1 Tax=Streptomyces phaeochromogenes TaxID=1923 RepID=UPI00225014CE|nr:ABC transporter substrate-binding protein [Streptomyces phaeochromogenes]MCX5599489.1 ABC transporter substrate-binding protein [Streptomyces phaeochromogenes]WSJ03029.1 ABC transporter substrate-binding protein [Streptomyces phaeochromogenes]